MEKLFVFILCTLSVIVEAGKHEKVKDVRTKFIHQRRTIVTKNHLRHHDAADLEEAANVFDDYNDIVRELSEDISDGLTKSIFKDLKKQSHVDTITNLLMERSIESQPHGVWGRETGISGSTHGLHGEWGLEADSLITKDEPHYIWRRSLGQPPKSRPPGLWHGDTKIDISSAWRRDEKNGVPSAWRRDEENSVPGVWGRDVENGVPGVWGRDVKESGVPGVWGREIKNRVSRVWGREMRNGVPGVWGREIENGVPGVWGRDIEEQ